MRSADTTGDIHGENDGERPAPSDKQPVAGGQEDRGRRRVRPEEGSAATAIATTPSPNKISTQVPRNSARHSPHRPPSRSTLPPRARSGEMLSVMEDSIARRYTLWLDVSG
jgi:hypothetical protein